MYQIGKQELDAVAKVIQARQTFRYHRGKVAEWTGKLETAVAELVGVKHAIATTSGTASLIAALVGLGVGPGDEVIVPGYTFISTALAPVAVGAVPIIAEVDETLTMDPRDLESKITRHTKAIIPVYMLGLPCNMNAILRIARRHKLPMVEDVAQAVGGEYRGRKFGSMGAAAAFSFNHFKILSSGEGGAVVTNDRTLHQRAMIYHDGGCVFFDEAAADVPFFCGVNYRVSEIQSAILNVQLRRLPEILSKLRARKKAMSEALAASKRFRLSPNNDAAGDCSTNLPILFKTADDATAFVEANRSDCPMYRPITSDRHVYSTWKSILLKQVQHPKMNPWKWAKRKISYSTGMCPKTLDVLSRTVVIPLPIDKTLAQIRAMARKLVQARP